MRTRSVPHAEWFSFFEGFTRRHLGRPATLWILSPQIGAQVEGRDLPLEGIVSDSLATSITIQLGGRPGRNVEHPVSHPVRVWLELTEEGDDAALSIESADGTTTVLELPSPVLQRLGKGVTAVETVGSAV